MKFHLGPAPANPGFSDQSSWTLVRISEIRRWQLMAFPIAVINMAIVTGLWLWRTPAWDHLRSMRWPIPIPGFVITLILILICHEFIHALMHPQAGGSRHSVIGFWPSRMLLYAVYNGTVTRQRSLMILLMPLVTLSLVPAILSALLGRYSFWLAYATVLNAFVSAGDVLLILTLFKQVPPGATMNGSGWKSYWQLKTKKAHFQPD